MSPAILVIRLLVGWVFLVEGILKFVLPDELGVGRFLSIGIPAPQIMAPFVGVVEIVCGALVLIGLFTRIASIALLIDITVAILSTKIPIWLGHGYWRFALPKLKHYGPLSMLHEARTDFSMVLGLIVLLMVGAGAWSFDIKIRRSSNTDPPASDAFLRTRGSPPVILSLLTPSDTATRTKRSISSKVSKLSRGSNFTLTSGMQ
jgi:putative oxidoreductase